MSFGVYDLEIASNVCFLGVRLDNRDEIIQIDKALTAKRREELQNQLNHGTTLAGFNNLGFDSFLMDALFKGAGPQKLFELCQGIIESRDPGYQVARKLGFEQAKLNEIDLLHYAPRAKLKVFEARLKMRHVKNLPFDPKAPIAKSQFENVKSYLAQDLAATELLKNSLLEEIDTRRELCDLYQLPGLMRKTSARAAEDALLSEYCYVEGLEFNDVKNAASRFKNCSFVYELPRWIYPIIEGTRAETFAQAINGTRFTIKDGKRGPIDKEWPEAINLDGISVRVGVGGAHSDNDATYLTTTAGFDIASMYPNIILKPGASPNHLNSETFNRIFQKTLTRRLEAKSAGRKRESNALKLILNSTFGQMNDKYSALYSPMSFLTVTLCGQLIMIATADRFYQKVKP
jgi:hypothetical protein